MLLNHFMTDHFMLDHFVAEPFMIFEYIPPEPPEGGLGSIMMMGIGN